MAQEYATAGGSGGILAQPVLSRSDMVLIRRAVQGGYNLSAEQRQLIVARATEILEARPEVLEDKDGNVVGVSYRDQLGAAKVLLAADKLDLEAEKMERAQAQPGTVNNVQINNGVDLSKLTVEQLRALAGGANSA